MRLTFEINFKLKKYRANKHPLGTKTSHKNAEITISKISMMMPFKCTNRCKIVFDHLRLSFNAANTVLISKICIK